MSKEVKLTEPSTECAMLSHISTGDAKLRRFARGYLDRHCNIISQLLAVCHDDNTGSAAESLGRHGDRSLLVNVTLLKRNTDSF